MKRIVVCFDGTWDDPQDATNVFKIHNSILATAPDGQSQIKWYHEGVGEQFGEYLRGGAFGDGIDEIIKEGYTYLIENYENGDEVFIFGFSRGAYTARSLVGLIRNSGLLERKQISKVHQAYEIYRARDEGADSSAAVDFRSKFSREIKIKFLGVWDTVGALGVPLHIFDWLNKERYEFHDTELSGIVEHAYHAVAIDEHRETFKVSLWMPKDKPQQKVEQRWFVGAHANVGGGYPDHNLSDIALAWMQRKAMDVGLGINQDQIPQNLSKKHSGQIRDSYREFLKGLYCKQCDEYFRPVCMTANGNECLDASVALRYSNDLNYRPHNEGFIEALPQD